MAVEMGSQALGADGMATGIKCCRRERGRHAARASAGCWRRIKAAVALAATHSMDLAFGAAACPGAAHGHRAGDGEEGRLAQRSTCWAGGSCAACRRWRRRFDEIAGPAGTRQDRCFGRKLRKDGKV